MSSTSISSAAMNFESLSKSEKLSLTFLTWVSEIDEWRKNEANYESIKTVEIENCPTTSDASKLISNFHFCSWLKSLKNLRTLLLKINEELNDQRAEKPNTHEFKIDRNFLISYESNNVAHEKIIYWKNVKEVNYLTVNLMKGYSAELTDFVRDFLIDNVNMKFDNTFLKNFTLINLNDTNNLNLLMKAVKSRQTPTLIQELLNLSFDINQKSNDRKTAADFAWESENFQILLQLLEENSTFPKKFNYNDVKNYKLSENLKEFLQVCTNMHDAIQTNNFTIVSDFIRQKPNLRYFYNSSNVSAATAAINTNKIEIYKILLANECSIGPKEDFNQIINDFYDKYDAYEPERKRMKCDLLTAHDSASKPLPEKHLLILCANSQNCHDDQHFKHRLKQIKEAFNFLNEIPIVRHILQLISMHSNFKINFDFNRPSVEFMNPHNGNSFIRGLTENLELNTFYLYIAAKELLSDGDNKPSALGTLAHELCHFAMNLIFFNDSKPYAIDDEENKVKFDGIIEKCKRLMNVEQIVNLVFNYDKKEWPSELIVRVPHMIVHYQNDSQRLDELQMAFKDLFDYYEDVVEPLMNQTLHMLEKLFKNSSEIIYNDLTDAYKAKLHHSNVEFQEVDVKFNKIIEDKNSEIFQQLNSIQIRGILIENRKIIIGYGEEIETKLYVERDFIDINIVIETEFNRELHKNVWTKEVLNNLKNFNEISSIADDTKMILLSDHAGEGKTTTFKHLSVKLKKIFSNHWIFYIDLKRYLKTYDKFERNFQFFEILMEILEIGGELEVKIFTQLLNTDKVILLYDGVDEISPKFKDFFIKLIENVRNSTKNQQWIATRPQYMQELRANFNQKAFKLLPYDKEKKTELIENIFKNHNDEIVDTEDVLENIENIEANVIHVESPLMIQMIIELYLFDKTLIEDYNLYTLYYKMIDMKKNIVEEKSKIVNNDRDSQKVKLTIWQVHQIYALKLLFKDGFEDRLNQYYKVININEFQLLKRWKKEKSKWTPEAISRYGFLYVDNWGTEDEFPDFVHRTFAEYFIAQFAIEDLYELDEDDDDDDDEMSEKEIEMRTRLLISIISNDNIEKFISSFNEIHSSKKMHKHFYELITSNGMRRLLTRKRSLDPELIQALSIDERFLKEFRLNENKTIFQYSINEFRLSDIFSTVNIYKSSLGANWIYHTAYSLKENSSIPSEEENYEIVKQESIRYTRNQELDELFIILKRWFYFLNLIDQLEMTQDEVLKVFGKNFDEICKYTFQSSFLTEKLIKFIQKNFQNSKNELLQMAIDQIDIDPLRDSVCNDCFLFDYTKKFLHMLEEFFRSDETICVYDIKILFIKLNLFLYGKNRLINLYEEKKFTKCEMQQYFLKDSLKIIDSIIIKNSSISIEDFIKFFNEIYGVQSEKNQLKKLLEIRYVDGGFYYHSHTLLSFLVLRITENSKDLKISKNLELLQKTLLTLAKRIDIKDDEIEKLSNKLRKAQLM